MKPMLLLCTLFVAGSALGDWQTQTTGTTGTLHAVSAVNGNVCWLAGESGKIIRTVDGGNTWSLVNSGIIGTQDISAFEGISDNIAFASTTLSDSSTALYRTTNAGSPWDLVFSERAGFIFAIRMFNPIEGIAVGEPVSGRWMILKTANGGETWSRIPAEPPQVDGANGGTGFGALDTSYVWFFDNAGGKYWSNNGGDTWSYSNPGSGTWLYCWNTRNFALAVSPTMVFRYIYGWSAAGPTPGLFGNPTGLVGVNGTNEYWLVRGAIYYSPNASSSWASASPDGLNKPVVLIDMVTLGSEVSAWATGIGDTVYHYHRIATGVEEQPQPMPRGFSLSQNYPNPFNPSTRISYQLRANSFVSLKVLDLLGQEVATLVTAEQEPGEHSVEWNAEGLPSGVYIYRLTTASATTAKKMLLLR